MVSFDMEFPNGDWRNKAECLRASPELFFPIGETSQADRDQIEKAKKFCVQCLVKRQCLEYALPNSNDIGIWGGLTGKERKALKRKTYRNQRNAQSESDDG